ncbi:LysR family transcriptional regulator [Vibrio sp. YIC-376]|uniref:LysR family transcriptional regulator n=1 Tax=Vibrio sp. YIC-376 TaxID=3136162 RepID=UPI00402AF4F6
MTTKFTLKQLRYFVVAGEHQSVTKAAALMFVSQPSISSAIQHLEHVTGLQLFVRHHAQGLSLTPQGYRFFNKAKSLLSDADDLSRFAETLGTEISGVLNVVGFPTFTSLMMPSMIKRFVEKYPAVDVQCDEMHQQDIIQGLSNCKYELAITYDMQLPESIEFIPLMVMPPYVVVSKHHTLASRSCLSIEELVEYPMVMLDWPMSKEYFCSLFYSHGIEPKVAFKAHSLGMAQGLVENGLGYSLLNTPMRGEDGVNSKLVSIPLKGNLLPLTMGIAKLKQSRLSPVGNAFVEVLKDFNSTIQKQTPFSVITSLAS